MRVLWVSHLVPFPPKSGPLLRAYHLIRELSRHAQVDVASFVQQTWLRGCFGDVQRGLSIAREELARFCDPRLFLPIPCEERRFGHVRLALRSLGGGPCFNVRWLASRPAVDALSALAASEQYDVVHFDTISLAQFRLLFRGCPATLGHHDIESHKLMRMSQTERNPLKRLYLWQEARRLRRYEQRVIPWFDSHLTCSDVDGRRLRQIASHPSVVTVPNGVDTEYFKPGTPAPVRNTLVFVASMDFYFNEDAMRFFTRAVWPALKARRPDATLGIVGRNAPSWLTELATEDPSIRVYGFVEDPRPYIEGADLYACPIRGGGGTRLKVLDALAMAKCIIAHPVGPEGIDVADGKDVVLATEPREFVDRICELLADRVRAERIGEAARALAVNVYDVRLIGRRLADHLGAIAEAGSYRAGERTCAV